jgi:hypothetical protein
MGLHFAEPSDKSEFDREAGQIRNVGIGTIRSCALEGIGKRPEAVDFDE